MFEKSIAMILIVLMLVTTVVSAGGYQAIKQYKSDGTGTMEIVVRCHHNLFSKDIVITSSDGSKQTVFLNPSGKFEARFQEGLYNLVLLDGNGGQKEYATATVIAGYQTKVQFIGHAVTMQHIEPTATPTVKPTPQPTPSPQPTPTPTPTPEPVCYWNNWTETINHPEVNHTEIVEEESYFIHHEEINHTVYHEAVTHEVYHPEVNHTVYHPEINHTVHTDAVLGHYEVLEYKWFILGGWKVKCTNHAEHGNGWHKQTAACTESYVITPAYDTVVVDVPAYTETVIDSAAYTEIVVDTPAYSEVVVDVPAWDEKIIVHEGYTIIVVDEEAWTETIEHSEYVCDQPQ